jgi:hypothetical protein
MLRDVFAIPFISKMQRRSEITELFGISNYMHATAIRQNKGMETATACSDSPAE